MRGGPPPPSFIDALPGVVADEKLMRLSRRLDASKLVKNMRAVDVLAVPGPPTTAHGGRGEVRVQDSRA